MKGFAVHKALSKALNAALYEQSVVIRKFKITRDENGTINISFVYGTIGMSPVVEAFGLDRDIKINNLPVQVKLAVMTNQSLEKLMWMAKDTYSVVV